MLMRDYSEKRDFHRMQVNAGIQITDSSGETFTGTCIDLSATGMQLLVDRPMEVGATLSTRMDSADAQVAALETECEVMRCQQQDDGYLLGVNITRLAQ
ncbi:PilZ domain-containing protein [Marinobacter oulmenensis]